MLHSQTMFYCTSLRDLKYWQCIVYATFIFYIPENIYFNF